jgi:CDP-glycerol glycerophosphotransferase
VTPRLSIVVPFYNVEHYFADCLDSLARQTFSDFEVVLVDDGSQDGSVDIARSYCDLDNRFRLVTQENQGLGPARNTGVKHSQGEYLTFVDSDDLVTRHAYELMINSLDRTSSDIAGGNARRFNNTNGVRQSYVHRLAYAANRQAVHVFDVPSLAIDRMVWNKVYRRTFWDQFKYQFPAIRYEDYPVTLRAHLDAITVDCIAAPVYYWRERESGESITQQKFQYSNVADRVTSAEMVLDLLDKRAPELRLPVHRHLAEVDLATIVQAFGSAADHEVPQLIELGQRLSRRLDPVALQAVSTFERLECEALQAGDVELLQRLARFRADGGLRGGYRARPHPVMRWRYERQYPGLRDGSRIPASLYRVAPEQLVLTTAVLRLDWDDDALVVRGTAQIAHLETPDDSTLHIGLVGGGRTTDLEVERFRYPDMRGEQSLVGFAVRVPRALLADLPEPAKMVFLSVELRQGRLRRKGTLSNPRAGSAQFARGARLGDVWVQPTRMNNGRLVLQRMRRAAEVTDATVDGGDLVLSGRIPADLVDPTLRLARAAGEVQVPLRLSPDGDMNAWTTRIPVATLVDAASPDDPFYGRTTRVPSIGSGETKLLLLATGLDHAVMAPHGNRLVTVTRSPGAYMNLIESPLWVVADRVEATTVGSSIRLTVSGPRLPGVSYDAVAWRRFLENSDDAVDVPCRMRLDEGRWSAEVDAAELLPPRGDDAEVPDWTLFAIGDDSPYAVQTEAFLLTRLPVELDIDGRRIFLQPRAGTLHMKTG